MPRRHGRGRPYEGKANMIRMLGFDTEASFDTWRHGELVKPFWDIFVEKHLETTTGASGKRFIHIQTVSECIQGGEIRGRRRFRRCHLNPDFDNALDWHAWLTFWLVEENATDQEGCFFRFTHRRKQEEMQKKAFHFILWAKRYRSHIIRTGAADEPPIPALSSEEESSDDEIEMDPEAGTAIVRWIYGVPDALEGDDEWPGRIVVSGFCGHTCVSFWHHVDDTFQLRQHSQYRTSLVAKDDLGFRKAQRLAFQTGKKIFFYLTTKTMKFPEEEQNETDDLEANDRAIRDRDMVLRLSMRAQAAFL
jgi:hypothetical protein